MPSWKLTHRLPGIGRADGGTERTGSHKGGSYYWHREEPGLAGQERLRSVAGGSRTPPYLQHSSPACPDVTYHWYLSWRAPEETEFTSTISRPLVFQVSYTKHTFIVYSTKQVKKSLFCDRPSTFRISLFCALQHTCATVSDTVLSIHLSRVRILTSHLTNGPP